MQARKTKTMRVRLGFSIMEILTVLAMFGIIAAISYPYYREYIDLYRLSTETRELVLLLRNAQQATVTEQIPYYVKLIPVQQRYQYFTIPDPGQPDVLLETVTLDGATSFGTITGFASNEVRFNAAGAALLSGTIQLNHTNGKQQTIEVKPSGFITDS